MCRWPQYHFARVFMVDYIDFYSLLVIKMNIFWKIFRLNANRCQIYPEMIKICKNVNICCENGLFERWFRVFGDVWWYFLGVFKCHFQGWLVTVFWNLLFMFSSFLISIYLGFYMNFWQCSSIFELFIYQVWRVTSEILGVFTGMDLLGTLSCGVPELCPWTKFRNTFFKKFVSLDFRETARIVSKHLG